MMKMNNQMMMKMMLKMINQMMMKIMLKMINQMSHSKANSITAASYASP